MIDFVSMHTFENEIVDCRKLQIEFEFSRVTQQQLKELAYYCISEIKKLLDNSFFVDWIWKNRRIQEGKLFKSLEDVQERCDFTFRGNVLTSKINNSKALDRYNQELFHKLNLEPFASGISVDYWDVYHSLFGNIFDPEKIRQNLLRLFWSENYFFKQKWFGEDITGRLFTCPYFNKRDLYFGRFNFRIALPCLGSSVELFSKQAVRFLEQATALVSDISGRVALSPTSPPSSCSGYMNYFGGPNQHNLIGREWFMREGEWQQCCFYKGVDWYNLLSPMQTDCLSQKNAHSDIVVHRSLSNGGSAVTVAKDILTTRISDLCAVKKILYPVLYPGGIEIPISDLLDEQNTSYVAKPRGQWENVPILEDEVQIRDDKVVIRYQS